MHSNYHSYTFTHWLSVAVLAAALMCSHCAAQMSSIVLAWNSDADPTVAGFRVHYGASSGQYTQTDDVGNATTATISGLSAGETYYFVVTAYNAAGDESAPSNEISSTTPGIAFTSVPGAQTVTASLNGSAIVPNLVSLTTATDEAAITGLTQAPLAGATVGVGSYTIVLTASDAAGNTATANVPFTVNPAALVAAPDAFALTSTASVTLSVLANDVVPAGYAVSIVSVSRASLGNVKINANNTITYTPRASYATFAGSDSFTYTISDGFSGPGGTATATVTLRNPFYRIKGGYGGLLSYSSGASTPTTGGYLTLTLTGTGAFTGSLRLSGAAYAFSAAFNSSGVANVTIKRSGKPSITLALTLDVVSGSTISGTVSDGSTTYAANTGARELYNSLTNPDPSAGAYTVLLPAPPAAPGGAPALPQGAGWATMHVTENGAVSVVGKLGDGTVLSVGAFMLQGSNDTFPFYAPIYSVPGIVAGMITFEDLAASDCDGSLTWVKPAQTAAGLYRSGFSTSVSFQGAMYAVLPKTQVLAFSNPTAGAATIQLSQGNLASPIDHMLSVSNLNVVAVTDASTDNLKLTIGASSGMFTGSFIANPAVSKSATPISGVVYQKTNIGAGLFLGASQAGSITLTPQ